MADMSCRNIRVCPTAGQESAGLGRRETLLVRTEASGVYDAAGLLSRELLDCRPGPYCWLIVSFLTCTDDLHLEGEDVREW
jgi:hypothetical protein